MKAEMVLVVPLCSVDEFVSVQRRALVAVGGNDCNLRLDSKVSPYTILKRLM